MSYKILWATFILYCASIIPIKAESIITLIKTNISGGPKIEANAFHFISGNFNGSSNIKIGGSLGGFIGIKISEQLSLQEDVLIHYKTSNLKIDNLGNGNFENISIETSYYLKYIWHFNFGNIMLGIGPYADYGIKSKLIIKNDEYNLYKKELEDYLSLKRINGGIALTAGYEFNCSLQINIGYKFAVTNVIDTQDSIEILLPHTISMGVAYRFGK